jgi:hypothetical protein
MAAVIPHESSDAFAAIFVPCAVSKLRQGELKERLFDFQTAYEAANFLRSNFLPGALRSRQGASSPAPGRRHRPFIQLPRAT